MRRRSYGVTCWVRAGSDRASNRRAGAPTALRSGRPPSQRRPASLQGRGAAPGLTRRPFAVFVIHADVVVFEVAGELGGALVFEQPLEPAPRGIAGLLTPALGHVEVLDDLIEIHIGISDHRLISLFVFE